LGTLLKARGDLEGAEPLLREALASCREELGDEHPDTLSSLYNLGILLEERGDLEGAAKLLREELHACTARYGSGHSETIASARHLLTLLEAPEAEGVRVGYNLASLRIIAENEAMMSSRSSLPEQLAKLSAS
jgi:Flp pilus assembly protein TadD